MPYEAFVGLRYLRSKKKSFVSIITFFSIVGVVLGVSVLASALSITGGFEQAFRKKVLGINSHILVMKYGINFREYHDVMETVEKVPGVEAASPFIFHEMMIRHKNRKATVLIKGIAPERTRSVSDLPDYILDGSLEGIMWSPPEPQDAPTKDGDTDAPDVAVPEGWKEPPGILIGKILADKLQVKIGGDVTLVSPLRGLNPDQWAPTQMAPTSRQYKVAGIYKCGFHEYDSKLVMVDYRTLQQFFNQGDVVTGIEMRVSDVFAVGSIGKDIKSRLTPGRYRTLDWREVNRNLFTSLKIQKLVLAIILTFIVLVASFNIVSTLIMLVVDKSKEIAILKSMGATNAGIMRIFVLQGMIIGAIGTGVGLLVGLLICGLVAETSMGMDAQVYLIDTLPVRVSGVEFFLVACVSLTISLVSTIYPAFQAARLSPVEGLRYE